MFLFLSSLVERARPLLPDFGKHMLKTMEPSLVSEGDSEFRQAAKDFELRESQHWPARTSDCAMLKQNGNEKLDSWALLSFPVVWAVPLRHPPRQYTISG